LNDFHGQSAGQYFENWEIYQVIVEVLNDEYWDYVETTYPDGLACLFARTPDEIWDFSEIFGSCNLGA